MKTAMILMMILTCQAMAEDNKDKANKVDQAKYQAELAAEYNRVASEETKRLSERVKQAELRQKLREINLEPRLIGVESSETGSMAVVQLGSRMIRFRDGETRYGYTVSRRADGRWLIRSNGSTRVLKEASL